MNSESLLKAYTTMIRIRRFDSLVEELSLSGEISGPVHSYVGQEAIASGIGIFLEYNDLISSTHRGHGHLIAKGGSIKGMLAELYGLSSGTNEGRGGSMHLAELSLGILGANGIVGAGVPILCGGALSLKLRGLPNVAVAFFGDGAINQGVVLESLNIAACWRLPVIFVCENNGYAATVSSSKTTAGSVVERIAGFGIQSSTVDGQDLLAVMTAFSKAKASVLGDCRPIFINFETYRFGGHFATEVRRSFRYRSQEELAEWKARDPIACFQRNNPHLSQHFAEIERAVEAEIDDAKLTVSLSK
jgi:TPP-dependent pyruvate/acetoin dehydrogenase alpha subunit